MPSPSLAPAPAPSTVQGAVVFTDIVSFTEFTAVEGDAAAHALLVAQEGILAETLPADARLIKELGDGLMLWFPTASAALRTCLQLQTRFERHALETLQPLWVRMGIHWGQQTQRREDLIGHDVNLASRIANEASPSELLLSEATIIQLAEDDSFAEAEAETAAETQFEELGPVQMKGIPDPVNLYRAVPPAAFAFADFDDFDDDFEDDDDRDEHDDVGALNV